MLIALLITLLVFLIAGFIPSFLSKKGIVEQDEDSDSKTAFEYHLGSRQTSGLFAGLSSATTSNSAFMFVAMIPLVFNSGGYWAWLLIGWAVGIAATWMITYRKVRTISEADNAYTFIDFLTKGTKGKSIYFRKFASIVMVLFLGVYASGQLIASQETISAAIGGSANLILLLGIIIVLAYSSFGGLKATIASDIVQAVVVLIGAFMLFDALAAINFENGSYISATELTFQELGADLVSQPFLKTFMFAFGWLLGGFFEMGQPHVMARVMSLRDQSEVITGSIVYLTWFLFLSFLVVSTGLLLDAASESNTMIAQIAEISNNDKLFGTTIVSVLAPIPAGICLAGFLAASISTADAQILAAGAAVSTDWNRGDKLPSKRKMRYTTLIVGTSAFAAYFLLQYLGLGVYSIITLSWGVIASAFVPSVLIRLLKRNADFRMQLLGATCGIIVVILWKIYGLDGFLFEGVPGVIVSMLLTLINSKKDEQ